MDKVKLQRALWYVAGGVLGLGLLTMLIEAIRMMWVVMFEM
ncbi:MULTISPECIES: hypothetical protein [Furfurilactobacillus]|nr:hypothetical protein [Furfurilactobacillus milii]QLE65589.1 hypothetical protein LROSL2_0236 [Furfurilactobacillus rossiae]QLE68019.1 hypothetical protein LROSL3_0237 [Furfurilactobacillus rossiae]